MNHSHKILSNCSQMLKISASHLAILNEAVKYNQKTAEETRVIIEDSENVIRMASKVLSQLEWLTKANHVVVNQLNEEQALISDFSKGE